MASDSIAKAGSVSSASEMYDSFHVMCLWKYVKSGQTIEIVAAGQKLFDIPRERGRIT